MNAKQTLTITVEQAAEVLGVARSTAYELARTGELGCLRLRRRIVIPVKLLADQLGVSIGDVWSTLEPPPSPTQTPDRQRQTGSRRHSAPKPASLFDLDPDEARRAG